MHMVVSKIIQCIFLILLHNICVNNRKKFFRNLRCIICKRGKNDNIDDNVLSAVNLKGEMVSDDFGNYLNTSISSGCKWSSS